MLTSGSDNRNKLVFRSSLQSVNYDAEMTSSGKLFQTSTGNAQLPIGESLTVKTSVGTAVFRYPFDQLQPVKISKCVHNHVGAVKMAD
jgi:hypothetical protein